LILSAGLTPAWQQVLVFDQVRWGEVNRARQSAWCGSGKVLNAGMAAHRLGGPSLTLAPLGGPPLMEIDREFAGFGVPRRWIETRAATRVCTTILDRATGRMTELVENGRPLEEGEYRAFLAAYAEEAARAEVVVLIGSLPGGAPPSLYRELVACTRCPMVLDFRGEGLLSVLDLRPYVVKPNREELGQTVGRSLDDDADLLAAMHELNRLGAQWVVVTQGARAVWVSSSEQTYRLAPPQVAEVVNPIGCGDALAAGIAWATRRGDSIVDAVRLGMGAAADNLGRLLPCRLEWANVANLAGRVEISEAIRKLPSPFGRGAGGEGFSPISEACCPHPNPLPEGEGI
jgi:1-phosphofructokinase family hexose kinase